jgi:hypothetical protein
VSSRSRAAANLADHLTARTGVSVNISWDNPSARPGHGTWRVEWTDGPTAVTMRRHAEQLVHWCRPLDITALRLHRDHSSQAWAAALLTLARRGQLPDNPHDAIALAEYDLHDTDAGDWADLWPQARQLVQRASGDLRQIAALISATVTKPRHETPHDPTTATCRHCAAPLHPATTGRPARWCGAACRQAAHRAQNTMTKPGDETKCATCGRTFTPPRTGRPARQCSPACRTRAWRTRSALTPTSSRNTITPQPSGPWVVAIGWSHPRGKRHVADLLDQEVTIMPNR